MDPNGKFRHRNSSEPAKNYGNIVILVRNGVNRKIVEIFLGVTRINIGNNNILNGVKFSRNSGYVSTGVDLLRLSSLLSPIPYLCSRHCRR